MRLSVTELARNIPEYLNRVSHEGKSFLLVRGKKVLAELRPALKGRKLGDLPGLLAALPRVDCEDAQNLTAARKRLNRRLAGDMHGEPRSELRHR